MEVAYLYTKQRKEFGKHCRFVHVPGAVLESIPITEAYQENYVLRNPSVSCFDTAPHMYVLFCIVVPYWPHWGFVEIK